MNELTKKVFDEMNAAMDKTVAFTQNEFSTIRAGKATPSMLDGIHVEMYGSQMALNALCTVSAPDAKTLMITPFDKTAIHPIEKAIVEANIGLSPQNDGDCIRINIPPMTEERRKNLVKTVKNEGEAGKITVRNLRKDANEKVKKLKGDGVSEDDIKEAETKIQQATDNHISNIDKLLLAKEKEIMTI